TAQRWHFLDRPRQDVFHCRRGLQDGFDLRDAEVVKVEHVFALAAHWLHLAAGYQGRAAGSAEYFDRHTLAPTGWIRTTSSTPSTSSRRTATFSCRLVGTFLPMKSGRIGSSRCPRSTRHRS